MAHRIDSNNISSSATPELADTIVGPGQMFWDLGASNGNLIRSGNATVVRMMVWTHITPAVAGTPASAVPAEAIPAYKAFYGLAASKSSKRTGYGSSGSYNLLPDDGTSDTCIGMTPGGAYTTVWDMTNPTTSRTYSELTRIKHSTSMGSVTLTAAVVTNWVAAMPAANTGALSPDVARAISVLGFQAEVIGTNSLKFSASDISLGTLTADAAKKSMREMVLGNLNLSLHVTFTTNSMTAQQYLAQLPYFMIQWPCANIPLNIVHAHLFVG